ncbi:MAG: M1 family metallopeptidase [Deltaproteobacteria bacterium]|nr:M1 family metallopeptidase [Deltaproteobacteria bacterium]
MNVVHPIRYALRLEPDLVHFRFSGQVDIELQSLEPVNRVVLNILELAVWSCKLQTDDKKIPCTFQINPEKEELKIDLPETMSGKFFLTIDYQGWINDKMAGFYRSTFETDGHKRYIAVTQFQESDARRAFPCMDHPSQKAVFDIKMIVDADLVALSNGQTVEEKPLAGGKKQVRFQTTPPMSTYLLFFGVGAFHLADHEADPRVRSVTLPGRAPYGGFGLEFGRKALEFCETYYQIPYALSKMDLIAVPDFAFGAMENWGAITFRENLILHYPEVTSRSGEMSICNVIAHEIAHQWFGNLVTPSDWKYLWLNESFATYFAYGVVDHYHPKWQVWDQFLLGQTAPAMGRDGLNDTCAIEIPGGEHVVINTSTAPIIYSKGSSILRVVQGYIGKEDLRKGLQHYLKTFEYKTAASHHLWEALEETSGKPVTALMKSWIEQPGHPIVQAQRNGSDLTLTQKRFTYLENTSGQTWKIPVTLTVYDETGDSRTISILLEETSTRIDLGRACVAYKVNAGQTGFYRSAYLTPEDLTAIGQRVADKDLFPEDRWGLQNDLFAQVQCGSVSIDEYLAFLNYYLDEDAYLPLSSMAGNLFQAHLIFDGPRRKAIRSFGRSMLEKILSAIGYFPADNEILTTSLLRDQILWHAVVYGSNPAAVFAADQFEALLQGGTIHPDILKSVLMAGALTGGTDTLERLIRRFESCESEHERIQVLRALGCFRDPDLVKKALTYSLEKVPGRNRFVPMTAAAANPYAIGAMWQWFADHVDSLEALHPLLFERVIAGIVPVSGLSNPEDVNTFFSKYIDQKPHLESVVRMSLERLEINHRMRSS